MQNSILKYLFSDKTWEKFLLKINIYYLFLGLKSYAPKFTFLVAKFENDRYKNFFWIYTMAFKATNLVLDGQIGCNGWLVTLKVGSGSKVFFTLALHTYQKSMDL